MNHLYILEKKENSKQVAFVLLLRSYLQSDDEEISYRNERLPSNPEYPKSINVPKSVHSFQTVEASTIIITVIALHILTRVETYRSERLQTFDSIRRNTVETVLQNAWHCFFLSSHSSVGRGRM